MDVFGRNDPFHEMHQAMMGFGSFGRDDFFGSNFMRGMEDPFSEMMGFSNAHKNMHGSGK